MLLAATLLDAAAILRRAMTPRRHCCDDAAFRLSYADLSLDTMLFRHTLSR